MGARVGTPAAKEALAEALMSAAQHVSDSDSETLLILLRLVEATLAAGLHEYTVRALSLVPLPCQTHRFAVSAQTLRLLAACNWLIVIDEQ